MQFGLRQKVVRLVVKTQSGYDGWIENSLPAAIGFH